MKKNLGEKERDKRLKRKKESFWGFLCPCLKSKNSGSEKENFERESVGRQQFEQEHTQNGSQVHEQTVQNLQTHLKTQQFQTDKPQITIQVEKEQDISKDRILGLRDREERLIKFNIKRNSNSSFSTDNNKFLGNNKHRQGKQNSHPQLSTPNQQQCQQKPHKTQLPQPRFTSQRILPALKQQHGQKIIQRLNSYNVIKKDRQQLIGIQKRLQQMQGLGDYEFLANWQSAYENHYPINKLDCGKLMVLGDNKNRLLCKVSTVKLFPSASSLERFKESMKTKKLNQKYGNRDVEFNSEIDRYWDKRYFLFERFDQGIKLDEQSWYSVTPQAVADYISSKVNVKSTILDAFCGAGGDALKLAMVCDRVIANDIDYNKITCLINNAKIYDINNLTISCSDFFKLDQKVDAVYLAPPWGGPDYYKIQSFHPQEFNPKLSAIITKALTLSSNIFFLLPANTDIQALAAIMSQKLRQQKQFIPQTCALKLEKIYFNQRLKFVAGFFGNQQVQNQIKLTDQLKYIYDMLRDSEDGVFKQKRLIRKIRQEYGMVNLLNWVFDSQRYSGQQQQKNNLQQQQMPLIHKFEQYLLSKQLIDHKTLEKIQIQQQADYEYELKNRQNKSKKQKNKRIQKQKQKQIRREGMNVGDCEGGEERFDDKEGQQGDCEGERISVSTNNRNNNIDTGRNSAYNQQTTSIIKSHISQSIQQSQYPARDSINTVSNASDFHQDQLRNITYDRLTTTQSQLSIKDSIQHLQKYDSLDVSLDENYCRGTKQSSQSGNGCNGNNYVCVSSNEKPQMMLYAAEDKKLENQNNQVKHRFSSPVVMENNFKMKKVKGVCGEMGPIYEKGVISSTHKDNN